MQQLRLGEFKFSERGSGGDIDRMFLDEKTVFVFRWCWSPAVGGAVLIAAWKMIVVFVESHYLLSILYILLG